MIRVLIGKNWQDKRFIIIILKIIIDNSKHIYILHIIIEYNDIKIKLISTI